MEVSSLLSLVKNWLPLIEQVNGYDVILFPAMPPAVDVAPLSTLEVTIIDNYLQLAIPGI